MCSSTPVPLIELHCTDEEALEHLERLIRGGPLPRNVIMLNPYNFDPWNLPDNVWCFIKSEDHKAIRTGYWKAKGEGHRIPKNSTTSGCRTTFEFYKAKAPHGTGTDWMMYEYKIYWREFEIQDSSSLCRVFCNNKLGPDHEDLQSRPGADDANGDYIHPKPAIKENAEENCLGTQDGSSRSQITHGIEENESKAFSEKNLPDQRLDDPVEEPHEDYDFSGGDYLELFDLDNPGSPSSSENSSCLTMSSDECFDSLALLEELEGGNVENIETNQITSNFSVSTSHRPDQIVFEPTSGPDQIVFEPTSGSAVQQHDLNKKTGKHIADQGTSTSSPNEPASSRGLPTVSDGKRKAVSRMTKLRKKYLCFIPF